MAPPVSARIIIFAKAPVAGRVKTRLIPLLGAEGAADLARTMLAHTIEEALAAGLGQPEICADPDPADETWQGSLPHRGVRLSAQGAGDLGERLARAAERVITEQGSVLLIGTDCPALNRDRLRAAAAELRRHDAVIVPAEDGGYVALGLRRYDRSLFSAIRWSTPSVARDTIARIEALGWSLARRPALRDIDTPADLAAAETGW